MESVFSGNAYHMHHYRRPYRRPYRRSYRRSYRNYTAIIPQAIPQAIPQVIRHKNNPPAVSPNDQVPRYPRQATHPNLY